MEMMHHMLTKQLEILVELLGTKLNGVVLTDGFHLQPADSHKNK